MQSHELKKPKHHKRKYRVGRGGRRGTFSGRGVKGQKARAGYRLRPQIWDYITETPKLTGPTSKAGQNIGKSKPPVLTVNLSDINNAAKSGDVINPAFLVKNKILRRYKGRLPRVKVLGTGKVTKKLVFENVEVSASAKEKIEASGGTIKINNK